jgi:PAS domain S-box-containing protein
LAGTSVTIQATMSQRADETCQARTALLLIIENDPATLRALPEILGTRMYRASVEASPSTSEALDLIRKTDYDVIIGDIKMFGSDGLHVLERIRQYRPHTPTLLLTDRPEREVAALAVEAGAYALMTKPVDPDYFTALVKRAVQMRHLTRQVEEQKRVLEHQTVALEQLVSERTAELARKDREQQVIFNSVPAMIWYKDSHNRILRVNQPAAASLGLRIDEVEGKSTYDLYPDEAVQYHKDDLEVITSGKPKLGIIEPYQTGLGHKRWVRTDKVPYRDEAGKVVGVIVFAVDITDCLDRFARRLGEKNSKRSPLQGQA